MKPERRSISDSMSKTREASKSHAQIAAIGDNSIPLYMAEAPITLAKLFDPSERNGKSSNLPNQRGIVSHLYNKKALMGLKHADTHHNACLCVKIACTVGLGFMGPDDFARLRRKALQMTSDPEFQASVRKSLDAISSMDVEVMELVRKSGEGTSGINMHTVLQAFYKIYNGEAIFEKSKAEKSLDPLCDVDFQNLLSSVCEDFEYGDGYIEVKRNSDNRITGLYFVKAGDCRVSIDNDIGDYHFVIDQSSDNIGGRKHFARFGDKREFLERIRSGSVENSDDIYASRGKDALDPENVSEIIDFRMPTNASKHYGHSDWLSAVPNIELSKAITQYKYDFFRNRGVPEFLLMFSGGQINPDDWKKIENAVYSTQDSITQTRKSVALNLENPNIEMSLEKLGAENMADTYQTDSETVASKIVSAHRVPPLLANILIPGKLGSVNELPNALAAFQALVISQRQKIISKRLASTLGTTEAGLGLGERDFVFRSVTQLLELGQMDTVSRMREPLASGRDPSNGLKE